MEGYCSLELDLESGKRGERNEAIERLICALCGAEAAVAANNNAAAVLLALNTLCLGKEAIISRGQLIEIGGSFRLPDVMEKSGTLMREVGTTNKTRLQDYEKALNADTGAIVIAHTSNYRVVGFTEEPELMEVVELAHRSGVPVIHDLGGGVLIDLRRFGLPYSPWFRTVSPQASMWSPSAATRCSAGRNPGFWSAKASTSAASMPIH